MKKFYFFLSLLVLPLLSTAQSKISAPTAIWPELQLSYGLGENGLLFLQNQYRINTDGRYNGVGNFERIEFTLGYEHAFTDHWLAGAMFRYAKEDMPSSNFTSAFLRHAGNIKGLYFNKQLTLDYVNQERRDPFARFRLMVELGKRIPVGARFLTPSLSYEMLVVKDFGDETNELLVRTIDRTRLRVDATYEISDKLRVTPYFLRQTDYYFVEVGPKYDEDGMLVEQGYTTKRNRISPVFGLELKYAFNRATSTGSYTY
ncbi:DUF2490 domain-containing protein [Pontibacter ramchanderi]|uniref:Uncharacterized protein DUF2490 n=1 Tax=Pontibacter ramchanderi TaxID=1179743 RepID=A0A2N3UBG1_9BACT|nr:DUF2490 domain-containing protein [Pontibacter ramchanderi]PKV66697.1 uncharacterized protein DUF2490 [Pontibacter ramchanderi]